MTSRTRRSAPMCAGATPGPCPRRTSPPVHPSEAGPVTRPRLRDGPLAAFLSVHSLGVKAMARHDAELFRIMLPYLTLETTDGQVTLAEFVRKHPVVRITPTVEEFRQIATIASAHGI